MSILQMFVDMVLRLLAAVGPEVFFGIGFVVLLLLAVGMSRLSGAHFGWYDGEPRPGDRAMSGGMILMVKAAAVVAGLLLVYEVIIR